MKKQLSALFLALMMVLLCALPASADVQLKTVNYSNGDVYIGQVKDGLPHGVGTYTMTDGAYYHGDFVDGHFDGKGIYVWPSGNSYTGDFVRDMFQGKGVYTWASGGIYAGDFVNDVRTGKGTLIWPEGETYTGDFLNGKMTGFGVYSYAEGCYVGEFLDDVYHGQGTLYASDGSVVQSGTFEYGVYVIEGEQFTVTATGFQSDVTVTVTIDDTGKIVAIEADSSNETPGFGTRCGKDEAFLNQFIGQTLPVKVDALSGATVTSRAIEKAVNSLAPAEEAPAVEGTEYTASAKGFASDVHVTVVIDAEGKIAAITVDSSNETHGFGTRCMDDEEFLSQFIGQTLPVKVDALSGATVTSRAIETAVNCILPAEPIPAKVRVVEGTQMTASAKGFASDVIVTVTVDDDGKIVAIEVDSSKETNGFGTRCMDDEEFLSQFIGQTIPVDVDALSGASVTSRAIETAVNSLTPAEPIPAKSPVIGGTQMTATAKGFASDVIVTVTVDDTGKIVAIEVDSSNETPGFGVRCMDDEEFLSQFIGQTIPVDVDALSGASVTSRAIEDAVNSLAPVK